MSDGLKKFRINLLKIEGFTICYTEERYKSARTEARRAVRVARKRSKLVENIREVKRRYWVEVKGVRKG